MLIQMYTILNKLESVLRLLHVYCMQYALVVLIINGFKILRNKILIYLCY